MYAVYCTWHTHVSRTQTYIHSHTCIHTSLSRWTQQAPGHVPLLECEWAWGERVVLACTRHHIAPSHSASNLSCMCAQPAHRQILHSAAPWCTQAPCLHMGISDTFSLWPAACHGHSYLHTLRRCKELARAPSMPSACLLFLHMGSEGSVTCPCQLPARACPRAGAILDWRERAWRRQYFLT